MFDKIFMCIGVVNDIQLKEGEKGAFANLSIKDGEKNYYLTIFSKSFIEEKLSKLSHGQYVFCTGKITSYKTKDGIWKDSFNCTQVEVMQNELKLAF